MLREGMRQNLAHRFELGQILRLGSTSIGPMSSSFQLNPANIGLLLAASHSRIVGPVFRPDSAPSSTNYLSGFDQLWGRRRPKLARFQPNLSEFDQIRWVRPNVVDFGQVLSMSAKTCRCRRSVWPIKDWPRSVEIRQSWAASGHSGTCSTLCSEEDSDTRGTRHAARHLTVEFRRGELHVPEAHHTHRSARIECDRSELANGYSRLARGLLKIGCWCCNVHCSRHGLVCS